MKTWGRKTALFCSLSKKCQGKFYGTRYWNKVSAKWELYFHDLAYLLDLFHGQQRTVVFAGWGDGSGYDSGEGGF